MRRYGRAGFTLIELMVVIIIVGLTLSIAVTQIDFLSPRSRLSAGARTIASSIILAHNRAVVLGKSVVIQYNLAKGYHRLLLPPTGPDQPPQQLGIQMLAQGVSFTAIITATGKKYTPGVDLTVEISLSPMGTVMGHVVHLSNDRGDKVTIEVNPITCLVQIKDGHLPLQIIEKS